MDRYRDALSLELLTSLLSAISVLTCLSTSAALEALTSSRISLSCVVIIKEISLDDLRHS